MASTKDYRDFILEQLSILDNITYKKRSNMATTKDYRDYIIEELNLLDNITYKQMMGEFLLYYNGVLFGGIYDDRLLVKIVDNNKKYQMKETIPYENAKPMYLVDDIDDQEQLKSIIEDTYKDLKK